MTFIWPWMLLSLFLVPVLILLYLRLLRKRQQAAARLGPLGLVQGSSGTEVNRRRHIPHLFSLLGLTLLCFSLARPEMMVDLPRMEGTVILAFDVSNSMAADDLEPSRIEAAKVAAKSFVENQPPTIRIGVVAFSNGGLVVQPPTDDQALLNSAIDRLSPQGATSLGQGIFGSLNAIAGEPIPIDPSDLDEELPELDIAGDSSAVVLLLSDGENTESPDPFKIAQLAAEAGVRIYAVGIGSVEGTVLEVEGFNILTQLNEAVLQEIASVTNGDYYHADDAETLQEVYETVDLELTISGESMEVTSLIAGISLLFFLISGALSLFWFGRLP